MTRWALDPAIPVVEMWARWLSEVVGEIDPRTSATYELYGRTHVGPFFGTLGGISSAATAQYQRTRLRSVKRETVQKEISTLRRFLAWCAEQGYLDSPPEVPRLRRGTLGTKFKVRRRGRPTELKPEEVRATIDELPEWSESRRVKPFPVRARFVVAFETTLRPSTLEALSVPEHYKRGADSITITDEIDKARFGRILRLSAEARAALDTICPETGLIFGTHDYRDQLKKAAGKTLPPHKVETFCAYDFRHARHHAARRNRKPPRHRVPRRPQAGHDDESLRATWPARVGTRTRRRRPHRLPSPGTCLELWLASAHGSVGSGSSSPPPR